MPMTTKRLALAVAMIAIALAGLSGRAQPFDGLRAVPSTVEGQQTVLDWPAVAGDVGGMKYSPADQITPANVATLKEAWSYQGGGPAPIVINNVMYFAGGGNAVALNAETGAEIWKFALSEATPGGAIRRGMTYWPGNG